LARYQRRCASERSVFMCELALTCPVYSQRVVLGLHGGLAEYKTTTALAITPESIPRLRTIKRVFTSPVRAVGVIAEFWGARGARPSSRASRQA
jgi:hypothetical protein